MRVNAYVQYDNGHKRQMATLRPLTEFFDVDDVAGLAKAFRALRERGAVWMYPGTPVEFLLEHPTTGH